MKKDIHPEYAPIVFNDLASGTKFLTRSTATSDKTIEWEDGSTYPVIDVEISSASHPFYTGKQRILDSAGRVEKFKDGRRPGARQRPPSPALAAGRPPTARAPGRRPASRASAAPRCLPVGSAWGC